MLRAVPERLELLYEAGGLLEYGLPSELAEAYGGGLGFERPRLVTNFVQTIDGVVAIPAVPQSNALIADESESDRFVMALVRACADAVLVGTGTLRASPGGLWTAEQAYPPLATAFAELQRSLDLAPVPERVVLTGSGDVPASHRVFAEGALVLTTETGAARLDGRLPDASTVLALGDSDTVDVRAAVSLLRERGNELILSEAGPHTFALLVGAGLVDELFLTVSPLVAGRSPSSERFGLVEGHEALPDRRLRGRLLSIRRAEQHLFLRYELARET
jgi:riboflavin biosynthesis pyrimidine reductase